MLALQLREAFEGIFSSHIRQQDSILSLIRSSDSGTGSLAASPSRPLLGYRARIWKLLSFATRWRWLFLYHLWWLLLDLRINLRQVCLKVLDKRGAFTILLAVHLNNIVIDLYVRGSFRHLRHFLIQNFLVVQNISHLVTSEIALYLLIWIWIRYHIFKDRGLALRLCISPLLNHICHFRLVGSLHLENWIIDSCSSHTWHVCRWSTHHHLGADTLSTEEIWGASQLFHSTLVFLFIKVGITLLVLISIKLSPNLTLSYVLIFIGSFYLTSCNLLSIRVIIWQVGTLFHSGRKGVSHARIQLALLFSSLLIRICLRLERVASSLLLRLYLLSFIILFSLFRIINILVICIES